MGNRVCNGIGEGVVILISGHKTDKRVVVFHVVGLTNQWYLELRIAYRLITAPFILKPICRSARLQRKSHMQRIDYIDILTAYHHIRRTGRCTRGRNGCGECTFSGRNAQATRGIIIAIKVARIRYTSDSIVGFPFLTGSF